MHGIIEVILPPKGELRGFEKDIAETLKGMVKVIKITIMATTFMF